MSDSSNDKANAIGGILEGLDAWLERASDWVNPILVKETRQAFKSQQFVLWFLLLLGGCWVVTIGGLAIIGPAAYHSAAGGQMFQWYAWMLAFPLLVVVPFSAFRSLMAEQEDNTRDLLTVSALTPRQVINGKLGSATLQMMIYLSAIAPCLGFTYLLRGIDAFTLLWLPLLGVVACLGLSLLGLLLASLSMARYMQVLLSVLFVGGLLLLFWFAGQTASYVVERGYLYYRSQSFWIAQGAWLTGFATTALLAYLAAIAKNTFTSANRSTPLRVAMLVQQAAFIGWATVFWQEDWSFSVPTVGCVLALAYWTLVGMVMTGERPVLSERVRRTLPSSLLGRSLFSWLTPGPGTGYFFVVSNMTFCLAVASLGVAYSDHPAGVPNPVLVRQLVGSLALLTGYCVGYLGLGRLVVLFVRRFAKVSMSGVFLIHLLIQFAGYSLPGVIRGSSSRPFVREGFSYLDLVSPIETISHIQGATPSLAEMTTSLFLVGGAVLSLLVANIALAETELRKTRAPLPQRILEDDREMAPAKSPEATNPWGDQPKQSSDLHGVAAEPGGS